MNHLHLGVKTHAKVVAFDQGKRAWLDGVKLSDNPYPADSVEAQKWTAGWRSAAADSIFHAGRR